MYHSEAFATFILEQRRYARFPEIIEFYSGIDRRRAALLKRLHEDLRVLNESVHDRIGVSDDFKPYDLARWKPTADQLVAMQREIDSEKARSGLPVSLKDQMADWTYDRARPYSQDLVEFVDATSLSEAMHVMRAAATALRNSDHVDAALKRELLDEVLRTGLIVLKLIVSLAPVIASTRRVVFDQVGIALVGSLPDGSSEKHLNAILHGLPQSMVGNFEKEIA